MSDLIIGKFYRIPAIRVERWWGWSGFAPIIGPEHDDSEIIGFGYQHFHIDWRFAPAAMVEACPPSSKLFGSVVMRHNTSGAAQAIGDPVMKRMRCKRPLPPYPHDKAPWMQPLHAKFTGCKLVNGRCPHRGIPVSAMMRDGDVLTCPGHGLRFSATSGELIPWVVEP